MRLAPTPYDLPITDGFLYNQKLRCNLTFLALALREFENLRRAGGIRSKTWCIPEDSQSFVVPAFDSYEFQIYGIPGSAIWGYTFLTPEANGPTGQMAFNVVDTCTDVAIASEVKLQNTAGVIAPGQGLQQPFSRLITIGPPGLLNVTITNTFPTDQKAQLYLYGGEPVND